MASAESTTAVSHELLERLAAIAGNAEPKASGRQNTPPPSGMLDVEALLDANGIGYDYKTAPYGDVWPLHQCLTSTEHDTGASITQMTSGAVAYRCFHNACKGMGWKDAKRALGLGGNTDSQAGSDNTGGTITLLTVEELRQRPRPSWLIRDIMPAASLAMLVGDPGSYKSFVALDWALCIASGRDWHGHQVEQGPVVYLAAEGGSGLLDRIDAWALQHGAEIPASLYIVDGTLDLIGQDEDFLAVLTGIEGLRAVFLDTVQRTLVGDENLQEDAGRYIASADRLKVATGATICLIHHNNRAGKFRGSSVFPGALDAMVTAERTKMGVALTCAKAKNVAEFPRIYLERKVVELVPVGGGDDGPINLDARSSLVFLAAGTDPSESAVPGGPTETERELLTVLARMNDIDGPISTSAWVNALGGKSRTTLHRLRPELIEAGLVETRRSGKSSMNAITEAGREALGVPVNPFHEEREVKDAAA